MPDRQRQRILLATRHPAGGILTYFRYIYSQTEFQEYDFAVITPYRELETALSCIFTNGDFRFISCNSSIDMARRAWRYLRENEVSLVNSHGFSAGLIMLPVAKLSGVPHLVTTHDIFQNIYFRGMRGKLRKLALSVLLGRMDGIHTVGHEATDNLKAFFPRLLEDRIHCIPNGIDTDMFFAEGPGVIDEKQDTEREFKIGFFGRFMSQKGFKYLVDAIEIIVERKLSDRTPFVQTYGWGGYIREEYALIEERGLGKYFHSMPHTDDMPSAIRDVNLVVMPSLWEACPLLPMEALTSGVPIVGTNCIGLNEVLEGSPATKVSPKDPESLAVAIANEMNVDRRQEFLNYAATARDRFSLVSTARNLKKVYEQMTRKPGSR